MNIEQTPAYRIGYADAMQYHPSLARRFKDDSKSQTIRQQYEAGYLAGVSIRDQGRMYALMALADANEPNPKPVEKT